MKKTKKSWRTFKTKESGLQKQICWWIRSMCGIILFIEAVVLWKQAQLPMISVERQSSFWGNQVDFGDEKDAIRTEQGERAILEQIFGVRLRIEEGVIEFYRKEEKVDVISEEK